MKPLSLFTTGQPLARHDDRAWRGRLRSFPQTDYQFQIHGEDVVTAREQRTTVGSADLRAFRKISSDFAGEKTHRGAIIEMMVFALITGLIAWPLISLLIVLAQTARG